MLMVYLKLDHAIRPMQKRGERRFRVRRESYRVNRKNAADRLLHAFPAMIVARWADARDYLSNRSAKQNRSKEWLRLSAWFVWMQMDTHDAFASNLPPFLPPLSPTTPITPYNPPNSPLKQINCLRPPRQNGETTATTENDNQMFLQRFFPPTTLYLQSRTVSQQSKP